MRGSTWADPEGVGEAGGSDPGKSQAIWVSIGKKQLDPPPPLEKVGPQGNGPSPTGTLENEFSLKVTTGIL